MVGSYVQILGPQLLILFEEAVEPIGGEALLEEVHPWEWAYSLDILPAPPLCFLCADEM